jgi:hypothetical protein
MDFGRPFDIMLEANAKDLVLRLREQIGQFAPDLVRVTG